LCSATTPKEQEIQQDLLRANIQFPTIVYDIEKPNFLPSIKMAVDRAMKKVRKEHKVGELYPSLMSHQMMDDKDCHPLIQYILDTAYNLLNEQGYNMDNYVTTLTEFWCQEHHKTSSMDQHVHNNGAQMVGFYFVDCPKDCSKVMFHDPRMGKPLISFEERDPKTLTFASNAVFFDPKPGMLMLTNAWLPHSFTRNGANRPMHFIHFNVAIQPRPVAICPVSAAEVI
jgi:uncharacterized protein (TIGR02466 family)